MSTGKKSTATAPRVRNETMSVGPTVRWESWMLRDETAWTLRMLGAIFLSSILVWMVTDKLYLAVLALVALLVAAWHLWVPREFAIDLVGLESIALGRRRRISWDAIRRVEMMDEGIVFWICCNAKNPQRLASMFVPYNGNRQEISHAIGEFIARAASSEKSKKKSAKKGRRIKDKG
ncbi:MAG: hypothetical protein MI757_18275 [Pirellulales bacterium]|nr:hypothetical protein [Pirellulales bacterium]